MICTVCKERITVTYYKYLTLEMTDIFCSKDCAEKALKLEEFYVNENVKREVAFYENCLEGKYL